MKYTLNIIVIAASILPAFFTNVNQIAIAIVIGIASIGLIFLELKSENKQKLIDKTNIKFAHLRGQRANFFGSPLKSTSTFLQAIVRDLSSEQIKELINLGYFDNEETIVLNKYFKK